MAIIADGFENDVLESKLEFPCDSCKNLENLSVMDVLRVAEPSEKFLDQAKADYVQSQIARIACSACGTGIIINFGHGEVQPARYRFSLYP